MSPSSSSSSRDSEDEQYKKRSQQRQSWDNVARGWQKWWKTFEKDAQKVNERLVDLAEIKQGDRVIDIATGIGEPAITAAKKVGIEGYALATDISSQMLAIAKERAISLGLQTNFSLAIFLPNLSFAGHILSKKDSNGFSSSISISAVVI